MLDKQARLWLRQNASKLEDGSNPSRTNSSHFKARKQKARYLAHPSAQRLMTFQEYRDIGKRDAICRSYNLPIIRD
jgi:protein involved in sex pheromone biosynthesis